jgi:hypothetical protein
MQLVALLVLALQSWRVDATTPLLNIFEVVPKAEHKITIKWNSSTHSSGLLNLTLYNNSGAWKTAGNVPYGSNEYDMEGLTVNVEYWFKGTWRVGNETVERTSNKIWGQRYPDAPINVKSEYGQNGKIQIVFEPPVDDGGSPISSIVVERREATIEEVSNPNVSTALTYSTERYTLSPTSTSILLNASNGKNTSVRVASQNFLGLSSWVYAPPSKYSAVRFSIKGSLAANASFPEMTTFLDRIAKYLQDKMAEGNSRRRRLLAAVQPRPLKVTNEAPPVFENDNVTFQTTFKVVELYVSELDTVTGLLNHSDFTDHVKATAGFNQTSQSWTVLDKQKIVTTGSVGAMQEPAIAFHGIRDGKVVLAWSYPASVGTSAMRGGGYELKKFSVGWHSSPDSLASTYSQIGLGPSYLGLPCSPPFSPYPCNLTDLNASALQINTDLLPNSSNITIDGLVNGLAYKFTLRIVNVYGTEITLSSGTYVPAGPPGIVNFDTLVPRNEKVYANWTLADTFGNGRPLNKVVLHGITGRTSLAQCDQQFDGPNVPSVQLTTGLSSREGVVQGLANKKLYSVRLSAYVYYEPNASVAWGNPVVTLSDCGPGKGVYTVGPPIMSNNITVNVTSALNTQYNGTFSARVTWEGAEDNGDLTTSYRVEVRPQNLTLNGSKLSNDYFYSVSPAFLKRNFTGYVKGAYVTTTVVSVNNVTETVNGTNNTSIQVTRNVTTEQNVSVFKIDDNVMIEGFKNGVLYGFFVFGKNNKAGYGLSEKSEMLILQRSKPFPPLDPTAVTGVDDLYDGKARVNWKVPYHGGALITHYRIDVEQHEPLDADSKDNLPCNPNTTESSRWKQNPSLSVVAQGEITTARVLHNLTNAVCYRFKVSAVNKLGESPMSVFTNTVVPRSVPNSTSNVAAIGGDAQVRLTWEIPFSNGAKITEYQVSMTKVRVLFPEGLDKSGEDSTFVQPQVYNFKITNSWDQPKGDKISFVVQYPEHPIYNGDSYVFSIRAINSVGAGPQGTHDDGTDASIITPLVAQQKYATVKWSWSLNGTGISDPVPKTIQTLGGTVVFYCTSVKKTVVTPSGETLKNRNVGLVNAYKGASGDLAWSFEAPQFEPFVRGETNPCPAFSPSTLAFLVSSTDSPSNSHMFTLATKGTAPFRSGNVLQQNLDDYQDGRKWTDAKSKNTIDLEFDFYRDHSASVKRPWVENLKEVLEEDGAVKPSDDLDVNQYTPPVRTSPAISRYDVVFIASSDKFIYAYDTSDPTRLSGQLMRFPYSMCDLDARMGFKSSNENAQKKCGCPGFSRDKGVSPLKAAPILIENKERGSSILIVSTFNSESSTITAVNVTRMVREKHAFHYNAKNCSDPTSTYVLPPTNPSNDVTILWTYTTVAGRSFSKSPVWFNDTLVFRDGEFLVGLNVQSGNLLWTFSVDCGIERAPPSQRFGAPFSRAPYDPVCDYVDVANRTELREDVYLNQTNYIADIYVPMDENHNILRRSNDRYAVYIRSTSDRLYAVDVENGNMLFETRLGRQIHSHPVRNRELKASNMVFLSTIKGKLYGLHCPKDAHIVISRVVYVCPELTIVPPTQEDLCQDLERPCSHVHRLDPILDPHEWAQHPNTYF